LPGEARQEELPLVEVAALPVKLFLDGIKQADWDQPLCTAGGTKRQKCDLRERIAKSG
jgi:hypothetical protein